MMPDITVIKIMVAVVTVMVPNPEMGIIMIVAVVAGIIMPVPGTPRIPVNRIITPVPSRTPGDISGIENKPDQRPGCNLIRGGPYNRNRGGTSVPARIAGIRGLPFLIGINRLDNIIFTVKLLIPDELYPDRLVTETFNSEDGHILEIIPVQGNAEHDIVDIPVYVVLYLNIIHQIIPVQVKIIDS